jgi:glucosamine--fructose-6-phosphate aminotransferase (isomerizing)
MCSVVGYIGGNKSRQVVLDGLTRLEYRGYDSAGFACYDSPAQGLQYIKTVGPLINLSNAFEQNPIDGYVGIGHTRWSTHGNSTQSNAHPHFDCHKKTSVVHNGIIENHTQLRKDLESRGHIFTSQTDTEVIAHLFEELFFLHADSADVMRHLVAQLDGAYAFMIMTEYLPDAILIARKHSPLCIGLGSGEMFVASDVLAFSDKTNSILFMPDKSWALVERSQVLLYDFGGTHLPADFKVLDVQWFATGKEGYDHYMLKEIYEQKDVIYRTVDALIASRETLWEQLGMVSSDVKNLRSFNLLGSGTSWHAARIAQFFFEMVTKIPTSVSLASEFRYMPFFGKDQSCYMMISQSGETADTLEVLRMLRAQSVATAVLTNVSSSTMVREADGYILTQAGVEVAVGSTKAFTTQLAALYWLSHAIAHEQGTIDTKAFEQAEYDLKLAATLLEHAIERNKERIVSEYAPYYSQYTKAIFLGRHWSYPFSLEAALKLKEIAYIFSQCYPAGELKHGPLALLDADVPVFIFSHQDPLLYKKLLSNVQEVKARNGHVVAFAFEGQDELIALADSVIIIPSTGVPLLGPLIMSGVMQFFVYAIAKHLGREIDKPRNLAKSVTVE